MSLLVNSTLATPNRLGLLSPPPTVGPAAATMSSAEHLVAHPETIAAILRQAQRDADRLEAGMTPHMLLDEMNDGTLSLAAPDSSSSHRHQKSISVISTPAAGIKSAGVHSPRPSHQWSGAPPSVH
jgi:hypothetical protein